MCDCACTCVCDYIVRVRVRVCASRVCARGSVYMHV